MNSEHSLIQNEFSGLRFSQGVGFSGKADQEIVTALRKLIKVVRGDICGRITGIFFCVLIRSLWFPLIVACFVVCHDFRRPAGTIVTVLLE